MKKSIIPTDTERSDLVADVIKKGTTIASGFMMVKTIFSSVIVLIILFVMWKIGVPWYFVLIFVVFFIFILVMRIIHFKRVSSVKF